MKILHLTHTEIDKDSRILKEMIALFRHYDKEIYGIGISSDKISNNREGLSLHAIVLKSKNFTFLPTKVRHIINFIELSYKMIFQSLKIKPHIIHCHDTLVLPLGLIVKFLTGSKLVYDAHELESNKNGLTGVSGKFVFFIERCSWKYIDKLITVSPSIERWYMENIGVKDSVKILNSPILSVKENEGDEFYFQDKFSISRKTKIFIYIGLLGYGRGIELILEVFKREDIDSHVVFLGYGELKEELQKLSNKYKNIHVHDAVPHEEVVSIAKSADIGMCLIQNVSLSDYYCLPNKLFEYCFAELPVLASDFPDISEVVKKYNLGLCTMLNSESIHKAVKEFEQMKKLPKIDADKLYDLSWEAQEIKLIDLYKSLENEKRK